MKGITILLLVLLAGCASYTPLEQLEADALVSGDWSLVEKRERMIAWQKARQGGQCPDRAVNYCVVSFGEKKCECVSSTSFRSALAGN